MAWHWKLAILYERKIWNKFKLRTKDHLIQLYYFVGSFRLFSFFFFTLFKITFINDAKLFTLYFPKKPSPCNYLTPGPFPFLPGPPIWHVDQKIDDKNERSKHKLIYICLEKVLSVSN